MKILIAIVVALVLAVTVASPVFAAIPQPDSAPTLEQSYVFRNLRETGDMLFVFLANIPYAVTPDVDVTQTYWWTLYDGLDELGNTSGYAYNSYGYGYNVYSMYFSADDVTDLTMVWGTSYELRLVQNPAQFAAPTYFSFNINAADYTPISDMAGNRDALALRVISLAEYLDNAWNVHVDYSLIVDTDTGIRLSTTGGIVMKGCIYALQSMAPAAFSTVIRDIDVVDREWDTEYQTEVATQWEGTWAETAQEAGKALFGTDYDLLSIIILLVLGVGLLIGNIAVTGDHWNGLIDVSLLLIVGARLGMYDLAFLILIAAICWVFIGTKVWFRVMQ